MNGDDDLELQILLRIVEVIDRKSQQKGSDPASQNPSGRLANIVNNFIASTPSLSFIASPGAISIGDSYDVGQAGAVGPNASAQNFSFAEVWNQAAPNIDLPSLAQDLRQLRAAMIEAANGEPGRYLAIAAVAEAEKSVADDNGPSVMKHLKQAGAWALDVAKSISVGGAEAAIKASMGP